MSHTLADRVIALAGVVQAAALVNDMATAGRADELCLQSTLSSIIKTDATDALDVFGSLAGLGCGLHRLTGLLGNDHQSADATVLRYTLSLLQLQRKMTHRRALEQILEAGVKRANEQVRHFDITHANVLAGLADTYLQTAGVIQPRIMVTGDTLHLQNQRVINTVRSLLLGGLRAAVLWRQCRGNRWMLLLMRARLQTEAQRLLQNCGRNA